MAKTDLPSPEVLRQLLRYDPETGKLFWRARAPVMFKGDARKQSAEHTCLIWNAQFAGKEAFKCKNSHGHLRGSLAVKGVKMKLYAHRAVWAMAYGAWPTLIDHINGDPTDNRLENLRSVTQTINCRNQKPRSTNTSGHTGVRFYRARNKWIASIMTNGIDKHLGYFMTLEEALAARKAASAAAGFTERHG